MASPSPLPHRFAGRVFTGSEARAAGVSRQTLRGRRVVSIHRDVFRLATTEETPALLITAARRLLPPDAALSHLSALWWHGVTLKNAFPLHFSTNTTSQTRLDGVVLHRRVGSLNPRIVHGVPTLGPDRTLVDCGTTLGHLDLVRAGDWLVRLGLTTPERLLQYSRESHLDGVVRVRKIALLVASRVDSVKETDVRMMLRFAHLPAPAVNQQILGQDGEFLARGDLPYPNWRVLVEYDGWHHERDAIQRQKDHLRRERLEAAGWRVIVVTAEDMRHPMETVTRVHHALRQAGYQGPAPVMSSTWRKWFVK